MNGTLAIQVCNPSLKSILRLKNITMPTCFNTFRPLASTPIHGPFHKRCVDSHSPSRLPTFAMDSPSWFAKLLLHISTSCRALLLFYNKHVPGLAQGKFTGAILLDRGVTKRYKSVSRVLYMILTSRFLGVNLFTLFCQGEW